MNPIQYLRLQNLFSSVGDENEISNINDLYHPQTEATEMFRQSLGRAPSRENYKPSIMRKIGAVIGGAGSDRPFETSSNIANAPFNTAMHDWGTKTKALQEGTEIENRANVNNRTLALGTIQREISNKRANAYDTKVTGDLEAKDKQIQVSRQNADTAAKRAASYAKIADAQAKGGQLVYNKKDGTYHEIYKDGTSVPFDIEGLTEQELTDMRTKGHIKEIDARADRAEGLENTRIKGRENLEKLRQEGKISPMNTHTDYEYDKNGQLTKKSVTKSDNKKLSGKLIQIKDKVTGKVLGTIDESEISKLNKDKYEVVK